MGLSMNLTFTARGPGPVPGRTTHGECHPGNAGPCMRQAGKRAGRHQLRARGRWNVRGGGAAAAVATSAG
jgi:hypothetical protein